MYRMPRDFPSWIKAYASIPNASAPPYARTCQTTRGQGHQFCKIVSAFHKKAGIPRKSIGFGYGVECKNKVNEIPPHRIRPTSMPSIGIKYKKYCGGYFGPTQSAGSSHWCVSDWQYWSPSRSTYSMLKFSCSSVAPRTKECRFGSEQ